ncbi:transposase [Parafilimonas sp.]|uniref:transposase n=1 Tax=Parafilimonas sp. TaxID=1969739 RepID=UPI0039E53B1B
MKQRGSLTLWVDANIASYWRQAPENKRGGQKKYRTLAIESCLVVRKVYHLPLRQTEGVYFKFSQVGSDTHPQNPLPRRPLGAKCST